MTEERQQLTSKEIRAAVKVLRDNSIEYYDVKGNRIMLIPIEPISLFDPETEQVEEIKEYVEVKKKP